MHLNAYNAQLYCMVSLHSFSIKQHNNCVHIHLKQKVLYFMPYKQLRTLCIVYACVVQIHRQALFVSASDPVNCNAWDTEIAHIWFSTESFICMHLLLYIHPFIMHQLYDTIMCLIVGHDLSLNNNQPSCVSCELKLLVWVIQQPVGIDVISAGYSHMMGASAAEVAMLNTE